MKRSLFHPERIGSNALALMAASVAALVITMAAVALSDVVIGDQVSATATSATVAFRIVAGNGTNDDAVKGCDVDAANPATMTFTSDPAGIIATPSSLTFYACQEGSEKNEQSVTFTASDPGSYDIIPAVSGGQPGSDWNTHPASHFTVNVGSTPPPADLTPPEITPNITGTLGNAGWYISDVTVSWTVVDSESAITSSSGCTSTTITSDTTGTTLTCTATSAGGTSTQSVTIKRDATAPGIAFDHQGPAATTYGWNNTDVTLYWNCTDSGSGAVSSSVQETVSGEGSGLSGTGTCFDNAGNSASDSHSVNIDRTAPVVTVTGVADGGAYQTGSVPAAGCTTTDALSGVAQAATLSGTAPSQSHPVGTFTATCSGALDKAGNSGSAAATYSVNYAPQGGRFGFLQPINPDNTSLFSRGKSVPGKFQLAGDEYFGFSTAGWKMLSVQVSCGAFDTVDQTVESTSTSTAGWRYDSSADQYIYNADFRSQAVGTCWKLRATLDDPAHTTFDSAVFKLTK
jgi:hypothetical protein